MVVGTTHDPQAAKADRTRDRERHKLLLQTIKEIAAALVNSPCSLQPRILWSHSTGTQRRNSGLTLRLSQDWAVGYREICGKRLSGRLNPALVRTFGRLRGRETPYCMDPETRDEGRCSLAAEALRFWGTLKLRATGTSMLPTLWPGDLLTVRSVPPELTQPGDIVLYMRQGRFFVHRVMSQNLALEKEFIITRGDCLSETDPPIGRRELLGKITEVERAGSMFAPARTLSVFSKLLAWMFCHWELFRRVGLRLWTYRRASEGQIEATFVNAA
jgi:hypothetical protein